MDNQIIQLEHDIASFISKDNGATVHFEYKCELASKGEYKKIGPKVDVIAEAYTVNSKTKEVFLLKTEIASTKEGALEKILEYVKKQKGMNSFTVKWTKIGTGKTEASFFYCHDVTDVVKNFFTNKNLNDYIVYEIKLNPIE